GILSNLYDMDLAITERNSEPASKYPGVIRSVRECVRNLIARESTIAVVSRGDEKLLDLYGRKACHFPQDASGSYSGYHPATSAAAISSLEVLRAKGVQYLIF